MNLTLIPLLIAALLLASADPEVETLQLVLNGDHQLVDHDDALIVGDARVTVPAGVEVPGPIYVIGGELVVSGSIAGDVTQLAGSVRIESGAEVAGELQHVAGTLAVAENARVGRRSTLDVTGGVDQGSGFVPEAVLILLLAGLGYLVARKRPPALDNVSAAVGRHPIVTLTVGVLVTLTVIALLVFMAFTLVLIPVTVVGLLAAVAVLGYGLIATGHLIGARLPVRRSPFATSLGVILTLIGLRLAGYVPLVGDLVIAGVLLAGVGAVLVTHFGVSRFRPEPLPN